MKLKNLVKRFINYIEKNSLINFIIEKLSEFHFIYKNYLRFIINHNYQPRIPRSVHWINTTLKSRKEIYKALRIIKNSKLNLHPNILEKNWDSLIALNVILQNSNSLAKILDAGGKKSSLILSWLYQYDYSNLKCINLTFQKRFKKGRVVFFPGDLTKTTFPDNYFDIITCISVIEHGVNEDEYFKEMNRILKKGGLLITSTDYWEKPVDTRNLLAYNKPVYVYNKESIENLLDKAFHRGFKLFGPEIDFKCQDKAVTWKKLNLNFTFLIFCLKKVI